MFSLIDVKTERSDINKILHKISEKLRKSIILFYCNKSGFIRLENDINKAPFKELNMT